MPVHTPRCWIAEAGLFQASRNCAFGHVEMTGKVVKALNSVCERSFELCFGDEEAAGEVVGRVLGVIESVATDLGWVQESREAMIDDVFVLVGKYEASPRVCLPGVELDDPVVAVPEARSRHRGVGVLDSQLRQFCNDLRRHRCFVDVLQGQQVSCLEFGDS
ncbi:hypothetical protein A3E20_00545 [Candidatus Saccharibacteria bacterium RIFCSPHIGHO2_12_FULL_47_16]|nr:MAG: hypothetical protein A3E20_00545 [Candidatus Saccharibacteria bacterium RIFCSPHIGHO2_12_FULL_47_16]